MDDLARYLLSNLAGEYALRTLSQVSRCRSVQTVEKYLRHLEEAFLLFPLTRFSFKAKTQARANRKVYYVDDGFALAKGLQFSPNLGKLCENVVAVALKRLELAGLAEIYSWKNPQQEAVDFVVKHATEVTQLIQVSWDLEAPKTKVREVRALLKAARELRCQDLLTVTEATEAEEDVEWFGMRGRVRYVPLWKWLLAEA